MPRFIASKCWANPLCVYILPFCFTCAWLSFQTWAFLCHAVETQYRFTCIIFLNALRTKNYIAFVEHVSCLINDRHKLLPSINLPAARVNDGKVGSLKKKQKQTTAWFEQGKWGKKKFCRLFYCSCGRKKDGLSVYRAARHCFLVFCFLWSAQLLFKVRLKSVF